MASRQTLETLTFDNSYARLPAVFYAKVNPTPFSAPPFLISANPLAAALLDLDPHETTRPEFAGVFGGSLTISASWNCFAVFLMRIVRFPALTALSKSKL